MKLLLLKMRKSSRFTHKRNIVVKSSSSTIAIPMITGQVDKPCHPNQPSQKVSTKLLGKHSIRQKHPQMKSISFFLGVLRWFMGYFWACGDFCDDDSFGGSLISSSPKKTKYALDWSGGCFGDDVSFFKNSPFFKIRPCDLKRFLSLILSLILS